MSTWNKRKIQWCSQDSSTQDQDQDQDLDLLDQDQDSRPKISKG